MLGATREDVDVIAELARYGLADEAARAYRDAHRERRPGRRARPGAHRQLLPGAGHPVGRSARRRARTDVRLRVPVALVRVRRDPRACHCLDVPFVFDNLDVPGIDIVVGEHPPAELAATVHRAWVDFVVHRAPGWPRYDLDRRPTMAFDTDAGGRGRPPAVRANAVGRLNMTAASDLTVAEQAELTAGVDMWHTAGVDRLGIAGIGVTDGPSGARGSQFTGSSSTLLPCGTALASTWNRELIGRVGRLLGDEARAKGASVLLAPTVNIHRHPLGGRNFECYSEDPYLTAEIAVAFIEGVQSRGVGCAVKHFVCNDQETDRMDDRRGRRRAHAARDLPAAVRSCGAPGARVVGHGRLQPRRRPHCSEHAGLLTDVLRGEWGFDGVVMSDWFGTHGAAALRGRARPGDARAAERARVITSPPRSKPATSPPHAVEQAAQRVLDLIDRTAPSRQPVDGAVDEPPTPPTSRAAAAGGDRAARQRRRAPARRRRGGELAVIGWRADQPEVQGGGSAQVSPPYVITPLQGITDRAGRGRGRRSRPGGSPLRAAPLGGRLLTPHRRRERAGPHRLLRAPAISRGRHCTARPCPRPPRCGWASRRPALPAGDFSARMTRRVHARRVGSLDALGVGRRHRAPVRRRRARGRHRRRRNRRRSARPVHHTGGVRGRARGRCRPTRSWPSSTPRPPTAPSRSPA